MTSDPTLIDHILKLSRGSLVPTDADYVESYFKLFNDLQLITLDPDMGFIGYLRSEMAKLSDPTTTAIKKLDKASIHDYLQKTFLSNSQAKKTLAEYVDETSQVLYTAVMGQERVIFTDIENSLRKYHQQVLVEISENKKIKWSKVPKNFSTKDVKQDQIIKKTILDDLIKLLDCYKTSFPVIHEGVQDYFVTSKDISFLYSVLGKVMEGSLSQSRKSRGGDIAEKIVEILLRNQSLQKVSCQVEDPKTGTKTDLVVENNSKKHCIAVQLSTNDRMRLGSDEYHQDSDVNYLVSLNGCKVSKKGASDISLQRMATWMNNEVDTGKAIPFYVGIQPFIDSVKETYLKNLNTLLAAEGITAVTTSLLTGNMADIKSYMSTLPSEAKNKFILALWAHRKAISFEEFVAKLKS